MILEVRALTDIRMILERLLLLCAHNTLRIYKPYLRAKEELLLAGQIP